VNDLVAQNSLRIDHKESAKRDAAALDEHAVIVRDFLRRVGGQRVLKIRDAAFVTRRVDPRTVRVNGVSRDADDVCADVDKVLVTIAEGRLFSRTNEREIEWIKHHHEPLATIIGKAYRLVELLDILR